VHGLRVATHAAVGSGRGWLGVALARLADLIGRLGATDRCALTVGRSGNNNYNLVVEYKHWLKFRVRRYAHLQCIRL